MPSFCVKIKEWRYDCREVSLECLQLKAERVNNGKISELILSLRFKQGRKVVSQQGLARLMGVLRQKTIRDWEMGGTPTAENQEKIAAYLGKTLDELRSYIAGNVTLEEFMQDIPEIPRSRKFQQILEWLPDLQAGEIMEVAQHCFQWLQQYFYPSEVKSSPPITAIAQLLQDVDLSVVGLGAKIGRDRLELIAGGDRPDNCELVLLAQMLPRPGGGVWTTQELMEIREQSFPSVSDQKEEVEIEY